MEVELIPECYADTALSKVLGFARPNHEMSIGSVLNALERKGYDNRIGIALVDKDKTQSDKLKNEKEYKTVYKEDGLILKQKGNTRYIILHPNFEKWTLDEGRKIDISLKKYEIPDNFEAYKKICKNTEAENNPKLKNYLNALKQGNTEIKQLASLIKKILN